MEATPIEKCLEGQLSEGDVAKVIKWTLRACEGAERGEGIGQLFVKALRRRSTRIRGELR